MIRREEPAFAKTRRQRCALAYLLLQ